MQGDDGVWKFSPLKDGEDEYKKTEELVLKQKCRRGPSFSNSAPTDVEMSEMETYLWIDYSITNYSNRRTHKLF